MCLRMFSHKCTFCRDACECVRIIRNSLINVTALNENVLSTLLRKRLGIETVQQQMLGQAVLNRLPFTGLTVSVARWQRWTLLLMLLQDLHLLLSYEICLYNMEEDIIPVWEVGMRIWAKPWAEGWKYSPLQPCVLWHFSRVLHILTQHRQINMQWWMSVIHRCRCPPTQLRVTTSQTGHDRASWLQSSLPREQTQLTHS